MIICYKCKLEKNENEFYKDKYKKNGIRKLCKDCTREFYLINKNKILDRCKKYYVNNKDLILEKHKNYRINNKDKIIERNKRYYENNKNKMFERTNLWMKKKLKKDVSFRLRRIFSKCINKSLRSQNARKNSSTFSKLPYTPQQLKEHLENQFDENMSWENYGSYWHVDHIYPQSLLPYDSMDHPNFLKCWALENLRPLEAIENIKKGNKLTRQKILLEQERRYK